MEIKITRNTMSETYFDALKIRQAVFVGEQGVPYNLEVANPKEEAACVHFVLYDENQAKATVRLFVSADGNSAAPAIVQRMAVLKAFRGQGLAAILLENLMTFAKQQGVEQLILHAQLTARGFYAKMGFSEVGEIFEEAGIQHITMEKTL